MGEGANVGAAGGWHESGEPDREEELSGGVVVVPILPGDVALGQRPRDDGGPGAAVPTKLQLDVLCARPFRVPDGDHGDVLLPLQVDGDVAAQTRRNK
jgi:hypothetical protein